MSDEEFEKFEVSDYDLETEFNPNRYRKPVSQNKHIYGIWAEDSDDDDGEEARPGFGKRTSKVPKNYSDSVAFVSAGIQKSDKDKEQDEEKEEDDTGEGAGNEEPNSSSDDSVEFIAAPVGRKGRKKTFDVGQIAGMRTKGGPSAVKGLEMYGMGAKLAMKMGYQLGKGLGKDLQGISAPIVANVRKGRGAIGAYGKEKKTEPASLLAAQEEKSKVVKPRESKWQKAGSAGASPSVKKDKIEYKILTADQVLEQKQFKVRPDAGHLAKTKVIDLTGREQRVLSGYHAISGQQRPTEDWDSEVRAKEFESRPSAFDMPELLHNIEVLKDSCEQDIFKNDRKYTFACDRKEVIHEEAGRLKDELVILDKQIEDLEAITATMKSFIDNKSADLEDLFYSFGKIKKDNPEDWELYQIYILAPACAAPVLKETLKSWNPLEDPTAHLQTFVDWSNLLGRASSEFDYLMWEAWMPSTRLAARVWNVKDPYSMLNFLKAWEHLISPWILSNILDFILPNITQAVEDWDPLSDAVPIHSWVQPWIPQLGPKLEIVYPTIRRKLSCALVAWHPSDSSAKHIILPWVNIFSAGSMEAFLMKNIVPKIQLCIQEMIITSQQQNLDQWNWMMEWTDLLSINTIANILESHFFPKWLGVLVTWLNQMPNYEEVYRWYTWWRSIFGQKEPLMQHKVVVDNLQKALEIIGLAVQNPGQIIDYSAILNRQQPVAQPQPPPPLSAVAPNTLADAIRMTAQVPQGFRDLVQMRCEELGLLFLPLANRFHDGKQLYRCGSLVMYISANVIYIQQDVNTWIPVSMAQLLQLARG